MKDTSAVVQWIIIDENIAVEQYMYIYISYGDIIKYLLAIRH